jgi:hypothetical protein
MGAPETGTLPPLGKRGFEKLTVFLELESTVGHAIAKAIGYTHAGAAESVPPLREERHEAAKGVLQSVGKHSRTQALTPVCKQS